jgi:hypothetical protein
VVPEKNRILNPNTPWSRYVYALPNQTDPQPPDSYDGSGVGTEISWGVVDDTCDGIIEADLVVHGQRLVARARVLSTCPDFSPDRRPFFSLANDLADRDLPMPRTGDPKDEADEDRADTRKEVLDLFQRAFETLSQMNLDSVRAHGVDGNLNDPYPPTYPGLPQLDDRTMTAEDVIEPEQGDRNPTLVPFPDQLITSSFKSPKDAAGTPGQPLPYTWAAGEAHRPLTVEDDLMDFLQSRSEFVRRLIRPPWGRFRQLSEKQPSDTPVPGHRDPRVLRDTLHDMRMPPYMRDSDENSLSLTWRDYHLLMSLLPEKDEAPPDKPVAHAEARVTQVPGVPSRLAIPPDKRGKRSARLSRTVKETVRQLRQRKQEESK